VKKHSTMNGGGESSASSQREPAKEKCADVTAPEISLATDNARPRDWVEVGTDLKHSRLTGEQKAFVASIVNEALVKFRKYQEPVFLDRESGILILHWSRQIGKSYTLAAWAVDRLLTKLQDNNSWLVTVLSNSRDNGAEFVIKCQDICNKLGIAMQGKGESVGVPIGDAMVYDASDNSPDLKYENMRMEIRVTLTVNGVERVGRIKVLAANPRTARGFSGDLILDEFAFHEDSNAIWDAAEPILSSNPEFLCRIASTGNGKHNMFYRMASGSGPNDGTVFLSQSGFKVCRVTRSEAWKMGVKVYDARSRQSITPDEARKAALDKRSYDQNYECLFNDENMCLLTHELIQQAEREGIPIDEQQWSPVSMARMWRAEGDLFFGADIGRNRDISVVPVLERIGQTKRIIAMLRMSQMRLPAQQKQLDLVCALPKFQRGCIDMTGIGLGLCEYLQEKWGDYKIQGVNFSTTEPISDRIRAEGRKAETAKVTEIMATELLAVFEERSITIEVEMDGDARDDLRKPEKIVSPGGRVSIAATRDEAGHADHFWGFALAIRAAMNSSEPGPIYVFENTRAGKILTDRRDRSVAG
jgi:phage FluMu gp28-like protein